MPRGKKNQEPTTTKRGKKVVEEEEDEDVEDLIDEEEAPPKKPNKKTPAKTTARGKKSKKNVSEEEEEDDLSSIDVDEEDAPNESGETEEVISTHKAEKPPHKVIDPKTPIGQLKPVDILSYLIRVGIDDANPTLKYGALNLSKQLTGQRRRTPNYGSKGNRYNQNNYNQNNYRGGFRGGRGGNVRGGMQRSMSRNHNMPPEELYDDNQ